MFPAVAVTLADVYQEKKKEFVGKVLMVCLTY